MGMLEVITRWFGTRTASTEEKIGALHKMEGAARAATERTPAGLLLWWCRRDQYHIEGATWVCITNGSGGSDVFETDYGIYVDHYPSGQRLGYSSAEGAVKEVIRAALRRIRWGLAEDCRMKATTPREAAQEFEARRLAAVNVIDVQGSDVS